MGREKVEKVKKLKVIVLMTFVVGLISFALAEEGYHHVFTLDSPDLDSNYYFGYSIAVGEEIIVVGEVWSMVEGYYHAGKAYVYDYDGNLKASLLSTTPMKDAAFGRSVAFDGETIIVGEPFVEVEGIAAGRLNIFDLEGNLKTTLSSPEPVHLNRFGQEVVIKGEIIVVSESGATFGEYLHAGRVHVYDLKGNLLTTLQSPEPFEGGGGGGNFGSSLDFSGNIIVVGEAHTTVDDKVDAGRVFLFSFNGDLLASLQAPDPQTEGEFGQSVAVNNEVVIVGEHYADVDGLSKAGKVHVFDLDGDLLYTLQSPEPEETAMFGKKVVASKELIIVGERGADGATEEEGRVHLYDVDGNYLTSLKAPHPTANAEFGSSLAICEDTIALGERSAVGGKYKAGRVHVYRFGEKPLTQEVEENITVTETEEETTDSTGGGIPSFPLIAIIFGLMLVSTILISFNRCKFNEKSLF